MLISYKKPRGRFFIVGKGGSGPVPPTPSQPDDEIWYTSTDDQVVTPNQPGGILDADGNTLNILSNTYSDGKGVIKLDGDVASFAPVGNDGVFDSCTTLASVSLPDSVTNIGKYTFYSCSGLASVIIPDSVTTIGERVFYGCSSLVSVTIGNSVTSFGTGAFQGCNNLSYVNYTGTVDQWCEINFANNYSNPTRYAKTLSINGSLLTEVVISDTVTSIGKYAFYNCENITSVTVGNSVTTIGFSAFSGCSGMTSATIGSSVTTVGDNAFADCSSLVAIESLPTTAPSVSTFTFQNVGQNGVLTVHNADYSTWMSTGDYYLGKYNWTCVGGLTSYDVVFGAFGCTLEVNGVAYSNYHQSVQGGTVLTVEAIPSAWDYEFTHWNDGNTDNPRTFTVNSNMNYSAVCESAVPDDELWYVTSDNQPVDLTNASFNTTVANHTYTGGKGVIEFNANLTQINASSFENANIVAVSFPSTLTAIGNNAFDSCPLTSLNLRNVQSLGMEAFDYHHVANLSIPASVNTMTYNPFRSPYGNQTITVDSSNTTYSDGNGGNCVYDTANTTLVVGCSNTTIPSDCTTIGGFAFSNCYDLYSIEIPASVTYIGWLAFGNDDVNNLSEITAHSAPSFGSTPFWNVPDQGTLYLDTGIDPSGWVSVLPSGWTLVQQ